MVGQGVAIDEDIVKENNDKLAQVTPKDLVHQTLECCWGI
jgi:hypothetical protein